MDPWSILANFVVTLITGIMILIFGPKVLDLLAHRSLKTAHKRVGELSQELARVEQLHGDSSLLLVYLFRVTLLVLGCFFSAAALVMFVLFGFRALDLIHQPYLVDPLLVEGLGVVLGFLATLICLLGIWLIVQVVNRLNRIEHFDEYRQEVQTVIDRLADGKLGAATP